jgi:hypothetical protein
MKGIIPGVGVLMTWTIIPGMGVHFSCLVVILVHEAILIVIPTGGHLGYYPSTGGQQSTVESVEDLRRHEMSPG